MRLIQVRVFFLKVLVLKNVHEFKSCKLMFRVIKFLNYFYPELQTHFNYIV